MAYAVLGMAGSSAEIPPGRRDAMTGAERFVRWAGTEVSGTALRRAPGGCCSEVGIEWAPARPI